MTTKPFHHGNLREALVESASAMLETHGADGVTLRGAARMAGVSQTAPYRHFASKEALLAAVSEAGFLALDKATRRELTAHADDPMRALDRIAMTYVRFAIRHRALYRLMFGPAVRGRDHPGLYAASLTAFSVVTEGIANCQKAGATRQGSTLHDAVVLWSLLHGLATFQVDEQLPSEARTPAAIDAITAYAVRGLLDGLRAPNTASPEVLADLPGQ